MSRKSNKPPLGQLADRALNAHELAANYLCCAVDTVFKDLTRAPHRLPPAIQIPGRRGRVWLESEVVQWLRKHQEPQLGVSVQLADASRQPVEPAQNKEDVNVRRVGRPTKRQQQERAQQLVARGTK
ncbi:helix-turn-helix transcriptional regulator [Paraburkholderia guartelaensis]|uniref:DNA-binding protein n=1 Tax=Paraburkholderia guartelaensis TaxID=2546446 RepID=A0ABU9SDS6_9BURK